MICKPPGIGRAAEGGGGGEPDCVKVARLLAPDSLLAESYAVIK
jgi:hypothetical protein